MSRSIRIMTTSRDDGQSPAAASAAEPAVDSQEWSEAFGDLDLDNDTHDTTSHQPQAYYTSHTHSTTTTPTTTTTTPDKLNIVEPLWFLHTDEQTATQQYATDTKTRVREILNFRMDRSASTAQKTVSDTLACWLYSIGRYQEAIDVMTAPQQLNAQGRAFNSKEQQLVHLDLLARCHHKLHNLPAALSFQRQIVALRPAISNLLLLSQMMVEQQQLLTTQSAEEQREHMVARAQVLMRCIEHCPVHASAWHNLALLFLALSAHDSSPASTSAASAGCCTRHSLLCCARLTFSLVADLTNFTINPLLHPSGDMPSLSTPLYATLLSSAQQQIAQLDAEMPAVECSRGGDDGGCLRCAGVCECWRQRLHRFACLPLSSLFIAEKQAEQAGVEGSKRTEKRRGRRKGGDDEAESDDDETGADIDKFDALDL